MAKKKATVTPYREATKISTGTNAPKGSSPAQRVAHHKAGMRAQTDKAGLVPKLRVSAHREKLAHAKNAQALGAKVKKAGHLAKAPSQHALQKDKKGGTFYLSEGGAKVYAKK